MGAPARPLQFCLVVHIHQPVGNFDDVIEKAYQSAYEPFLALAERFRSVPFALHVSGPLVDWLAIHRPAWLERVGRLVERGQVEVLTAGYYEPILPVLDDEAKRAQLTLMNEAIEERFGATPRGAWLTERVWEPGLVRPLVEAGVEYTIVDDTHFKRTGFEPAELSGYFWTEDQGRRLAVFPIDQVLRYLVPFDEPERSVDYLRALHARAPGRIVVLADDGEKFGVWPGTHARCYTEGWLERWFRALAAAGDWLVLTTPAACLRTTPPAGRAYLASASYAEMHEWSLPTARQVRMRGLREVANTWLAGESARAGQGTVPEALKEHAQDHLLGGGHWRHFLVKYPEANHMHQRVAALLRRARRQAAVPSEVWSDLWAAQCNCAYWHGVFGGLYLPHLRDAVYQRIVGVEARLDALDFGEEPRVETDDVDLDGRDEWSLRTVAASVWLTSVGGTVLEFNDRRTRAALGNTMARRPEPYHAELAAAPGDRPRDAADRVDTIHAGVSAKESGLEEYLHFDDGRRLLFQDGWYPPGTTLDALAEGRARCGLGLAEAVYDASLAVQGQTVGARLRSEVMTPRGPLVVTKRYRLVDSTLECDLALDGGRLERTIEGLWVVTSNLAMLAGDQPDRTFAHPGAQGQPVLRSRGEVARCDWVELVDRWRQLKVRLTSAPAAALWYYPVETVSLSEAGAERIYQASAVAWSRRVALVPGACESWQVVLSTLKC